MFCGRFAMNPTCPVCAHRFEREPGFFQGAMYVSYGIGIVYLGLLGLVANAFVAPRFGLVAAVGLVVATHLRDIMGGLGPAIAVCGIPTLIAAILLVPRLPETATRSLDDVSPTEIGPGVS